MTTTLKTYPKYKNTTTGWFPRIPFDWKINRGKFYFRNRKIINKTMKCDNVLSLTMNGVVHRSELGEGGLLPTSYDTFQIFEKNNLVFKLIDLENFKTSRVGIVPEKGIMSSAYIRLENKDNNNDPRYFYWLYYNLYLQGIYNFLGMGVRSTLNYWDLLEQPILIPPIETQKKIADFLDEKTKVIDELIAKKEKMIEFLREKRIVLISNATTKGLDSKIKTKKSNIEWLEAIPTGWETRKLKYISKIDTSGIFGDEMIGDVEAKLVTTGQLSMSGEWYLELMDTRFFKRDEYNKFKNIYGDIVVVKSSGSSSNIVSGKAGFVSEVEAGTVFGNFLLRIRATDIINSKFLYYFLVSHLTRQRIELMCSSTTYPNLKVWEYISALILLPPKDYQKKIVAFLDAETNKIKETITLIKSQIDQLKEYRSSLIYSAVTGKIKV